MLWITSGYKAYYWDGDSFREPFGACLDFRSTTDILIGGNDRELYASQRGGGKQDEARLYRLRDGRAEPVCDFEYEYGPERPGIYVAKSGLLLNWGEKFIAVYVKGRWNRTEASLSARDTKLVEVGDRVCLLYADRLYVVTRNGKVWGRRDYLDDPSIASNKTGGRAAKRLANMSTAAAAWGNNRLLLMATRVWEEGGRLLMTRALAGYDLAAEKPIDVERIKGALTRASSRDCSPTVKGPCGSMWMRAKAGRRRLLSDHARW